MKMKGKVIQALLIVLLIIAAISISCGQPSQEAPIPPPSAIPTPPTEAPIVTPTTGQNGWSDPVNISNTMGNISFAPGPSCWLLHDKAGNLLLVWSETSMKPDGKYELEYLVTSQKNGIWSEVTNFLPDLADGGFKWKGNIVWLSNLFLDPDGVFHLFWMRRPHQDAYLSQVVWSSRTALGEWSEPILIFDNPDGGDGGVRDIVVDSENVMHVIVEAASAKNPWIFYLTRSTEGGWSKPERLSFVAHTSQWPMSSLVIDKEDTLHLAWRDYDQRKWLYATKLKGAKWNGPIDITPEYPGVVRKELSRVDSFLMKADSEGALHFVWRCVYEPSIQDERYEIFYAVKPKDEEMSKNVNISKAFERSGRAFFPRFAVGQDDVLHVVWLEDKSADEKAIMYASRARDGTWSEPVSIPGTLYEGLWENGGELAVGRIQPECLEAISVSNTAVHLFWAGSVISKGVSPERPYEMNQEIFYSFKAIETER